MDDIERKINLVEVKVMEKALSDQDKIIWESMGLTPDIQSMENAMLLTKVNLKKENYQWFLLRTFVSLPFNSTWEKLITFVFPDADNRFWFDTNSSTERSNKMCG